jgi:hypothetical protein
MRRAATPTVPSAGKMSPRARAPFVHSRRLIAALAITIHRPCAATISTKRSDESGDGARIIRRFRFTKRTIHLSLPM